MRYWIWLVALLVGLALSSCGFNGSFDTGVNAAPDPATSGAATNVQTQTNAAECTNTVPGACATEDVLATIVQYLTFFAELCGALVIGVAVLRGLLRFVPHIIGREGDDTYKEDIRLQLGKSLALALEFETGADILKTAVAPSFTVIVQLAAIVTLRTVLNYFLERELRQTEERRARLHLEHAPPSESPSAQP